MTAYILIDLVILGFAILTTHRAYRWYKTPVLKPTLKRSGKWPTVRKKHLLKEPTCQACGTKKDLTVHHIKPFHDNPHLELDETNLITLCEEHNCHLIFGHLCSWFSYNPDVRKDVKWFLEKVKKRA